MDSAQALIGVIVVALALVAGAVAVGYSSNDAGQANPTVETVDTGPTGTDVALNQSGIADAVYSDTARVTNASGVRMVEGTDYEWNSTNGVLTVESDRLASENGAEVVYNYRVPSDTEEGVTGILGYVVESGAFIPLILMVGTLVLAIASFGGLRS
jgi:hypothetical protein